MEIIDNRKQKQDEPFEINEPFEIKQGDMIMIDGEAYLFGRINKDSFNFFAINSGNRYYDDVPDNDDAIMSNDKMFEDKTVTRVKAKVIIED